MDKEQVLYEDKDIIVCYKPVGIATQTARIGERDMVSEVSNYLGSPVKLVHRLDQPVEGILVFAKNQRAAGELGRQITNNQMEKYYYAVIAVNSEIELPISDRFGSLDQGTEEIETKNEIALTNYLYKDNKSNTSSVVTKDKSGAKRAELRYKMIRRIPAGDFDKEFNDVNISLARIRLITGRHHQIRVQMSNAGMCLLGDFKYADKKTRRLSESLGQKNVALCAYKLIFNHPVTGKRMSFHTEPKSPIFQNFSL